MLFEIFAVLWVGVLFVAIYFFVKSLSAALDRGSEPRIMGSTKPTRYVTVSSHHMSPTGHRGRRPVH